MKQAAYRLGVSRQWINELINRKEINTSTVAGRRFVVDDERFKRMEQERKAL